MASRWKVAAAAVVAVGIVALVAPRGLEHTRLGEAMPARLVVFLHGHGAKGDQLLEFAKNVVDVLPGTVAEVVRGPEAAPGGGRTWVDTSSEERDDLERSMTGTVTKLWDLIDDYRRDGLACEAILLVGFSLGARTALEVAMRAPTDCRIGEVVAICPGGGGAIPLPVGGSSPGHAVFIFADADTVVSRSVAESWARGLAVRGSSVTWLDVAGSHAVSQAATDAALKALGGIPVGVPIH